MTKIVGQHYVWEKRGGGGGGLIVTNFFSTNKQYVKIKLMQNERNLWSIFCKDEILVKL